MAPCATVSRGRDHGLCIDGWPASHPPRCKMECQLAETRLIDAEGRRGAIGARGAVMGARAVARVVGASVLNESGDGEVLRRGGHRLTPQRQMVLRVLDQAGHHLSAEEICLRIQVIYPSMSLSTVYRTLELLVRVGMVLEARVGGDRRVYELARDAGEHSHLICRACGAIGHPEPFDLAELRQRLAAETGYAEMALDVVATGLCPTCASQRHAKSTAAANGTADG